jgi:hypothetical protein
MEKMEKYTHHAPMSKLVASKAQLLMQKQVHVRHSDIHTKW